MNKLEEMQSHGGPMEKEFMGVMKMALASFKDSGAIDPRDLIDFVTTELKRKTFSQGTVILYLEQKEMPFGDGIMWVGEDESIDWLGACSLPSSWDLKLPDQFLEQDAYESVRVFDSIFEDMMLREPHQQPTVTILRVEQRLRDKTQREEDLESEIQDLQD